MTSVPLHVPIRLYKTTSLTSVVNTVGEQFIFQQVPMGSVWTGTVQVLKAPATSFHQATISGILWAEWIGYQPSPVLQAVPGETITITSFGLTPGTTYQCSLIGSVDDEVTYIPVWPQASNFDINASTPIDPITVPLQGAGVTFQQAVTTIQTGNTLAIQFVKTAGTATGFQLKVMNGDSAYPSNLPSGIYATTYPRPASQTEPPWWFVPTPYPGFQPIIQIIPLLNGAIGGTYQGLLRMNYSSLVLTQPVLEPAQSPFAIAPGGGTAQFGLQINQSVLASSGINAYLPDLASTVTSGLCYLIRGVTITSAAGAAAPNGLTLQGTATGLVYRRWLVPTGIINFQDGTEFYVAGAGAIRDDPAEGLNINNASNGVLTVTTVYDIVPFPQGNILN